MPNKTIYIKDEHLPLFEQAQQVGGESVSAVIIEALQGYVSREGKRRSREEKETAVSQLIEGLVSKAVASGASDIHIQPTRSGNRVRFRIDGVLREVDSLPIALYQDVLDELYQQSSPLGGSSGARAGMVSREVDGAPVDLRVSLVRSVLGDALTARLLLREADFPVLADLEPESDNRDKLMALVQKSHGLIVVTGPTGSGKTTTLYCLLKALDRSRVKVVTVEDPVEAIIDDCLQVPLDRNRGTGFGDAIADVMLGDLDALMVSEVRDADTADKMVKCALTGHLVFSTLHAGSASGALARLADIGVSPFMIRDAVAGVVAQRLVRKLCERCKTRENSPHPKLSSWGLPPATRFYTAVGCEACQNTGFRGRMAIYEVLSPGEELRTALLKGTDTHTLELVAKAEVMKTLLDDGLSKAASGLTTVSEVMRVLG